MINGTSKFSVMLKTKYTAVLGTKEMKYIASHMHISQFEN